jgi:hypothetical protein
VGCLCGNVGFPFVNPTYSDGDRTESEDLSEIENSGEGTELK